jgi:hypothetical protein
MQIFHMHLKSKYFDRYTKNLNETQSLIGIHATDQYIQGESSYRHLH